MVDFIQNDLERKWRHASPVSIDIRMKLGSLGKGVYRKGYMPKYARDPKQYEGGLSNFLQKIQAKAFAEEQCRCRESARPMVRFLKR